MAATAKDYENFPRLVEISSKSKTGLVWIGGRSDRIGKEALTSCDRDGYYRGTICGIQTRAHRVVFFLHNGFIPEMIDHIDGDVKNNDPSNLRAITNRDNQHNQRRAKGYARKRDKWQAHIMVDGKHRYLGTFCTEKESREAYLNAKMRLHEKTPNDYFEEI